MATLESLEEAIRGVQGTLGHLRDVEFPAAMRQVNDALAQNTVDHGEIKELVKTEVRRVNGDVSALKLWKAKLEGVTAGVGLTGKMIWGGIGVLVSIGCVVLGAALAHGAW